MKDNKLTNSGENSRCLVSSSGWLGDAVHYVKMATIPPTHRLHARHLTTRLIIQHDQHNWLIWRIDPCHVQTRNSHIS